MDRSHDVQILSFAGPVMYLRIDGREYEIDLARHSRRLTGATRAQRENVQVSPAGYGLHWPDLDEDLSIDGLIGIGHHPPVVQAQG